MALELTAANFSEKVLSGDQPVLVDFWATWCGPCKMVGPIVEKVADNYVGKAVVGKVNVDEQQELAEEYKVMSIPTLFIFKNGEVVEKLVGARPYEDIAAMLDKHI